MSKNNLPEADRGRCCNDSETHRISRIDGGTIIECRHGETRWLSDPPLVELGQGREWEDDRAAWLAFSILAALGVVILVILVGAMVLL
jgi:hypothetical protein